MTKEKRYCESTHNSHKHCWNYYDDKCTNCGKTLKELNQK